VRVEKKRCAWATSDPLYVAYHDAEWGVPLHDDTRLFEMLTLEGAQAGLSWITILRKREGYRDAFDGFDVRKVARYGDADVARLMGDARIVRNRLKIASTITNARAVLAVQKEHGSLDRFLWTFAPKTSPERITLADVPARTAESDVMSKALLKSGFRFVGSTICYAFMQACGFVDDHTRDCFRARSRR
jgi:DNA-3-methyladenine glycosylase I